MPTRDLLELVEMFVILIAKWINSNSFDSAAQLRLHSFSRAVCVKNLMFISLTNDLREKKCNNSSLIKLSQNMSKCDAFKMQLIITNRNLKTQDGESLSMLEYMQSVLAVRLAQIVQLQPSIVHGGGFDSIKIQKNIRFPCTPIVQLDTLPKWTALWVKSWT